MKKRYWLSIAIISAVVLASCHSKASKQAAVVQPPAFSQPIVSATNRTLPPIKIPGMIQPIDRKLPSIVVSPTRDPFAAVAAPTQLKAAIQPPAQTPQPTTSFASPEAISQPQITLEAPTSPQVISEERNSEIAALPPTPPKIPTAQLEITGIVQAGGKRSAIVREADGESRYVGVGDTLAGGQIRIKQINVNPNGEPTIVLTQNGVDITRTVGSSTVF